MLTLKSFSENKLKMKTESEVETGKWNWLLCVLKFGYETVIQQQLQVMANFVVNSRLLFARNIILAESKQFRSSPLHVAARRYASVATTKKIHWKLHNWKLEIQKKFNRKLRRKTENGKWKLEKFCVKICCRKSRRLRIQLRAKLELFLWIMKYFQKNRKWKNVVESVAENLA